MSTDIHTQTPLRTVLSPLFAVSYNVIRDAVQLFSQYSLHALNTLDIRITLRPTYEGLGVNICSGVGCGE